MSRSTTSIINNALGRIGVATISSVSDDSNEARLANSTYNQTLGDLLTAHDWSFAIKRVELALDVQVPLFDYSRQYLLPVDCLKVISISGDGAFEVEGNKLLTDEPSVKLQYTSLVEDPNEFSSTFAEVLSARLAYEWSIPLVNSTTLTELYYALYTEKLVASVGRRHGSAMGNVETSTWLNSRN